MYLLNDAELLWPQRLDCIDIVKAMETRKFDDIGDRIYRN